MIRLILLKDIKVLIQVAILVTCFLLFFNTKTYKINHHNLENQTIIFNAYRDDITEKDGGISVKGFDNSFNHQAIQCFLPTDRIMNHNATLYRFKIKTDIAPLDEPRNINQRDYRINDYGKNIYFKTSKAQLVGYKSINQFSFFSIVHSWRCFLIKRCQKMPNPLQAYCRGVLIGDQNDYMKNNTGKMQRLGIIHLFCISGLHVFYLLSFLDLIALIFDITIEDTRILKLIILPVYFIIGGASTSLFRAIMLCELKILKDIFNLKKVSTINIWCITLLLNFIINPFVLLQMGGLLSYLISLLLITNDDLNGWQLSTAIFMVQMPIILYFNYQINIISIILNMLFVPVFSSFIMPCLLLSMLFNPLVIPINTLINLNENILNLIDSFGGLITLGKMPLVITIILTIISFKLVQGTQRIKKKKYLICYLGLMLGCFMFYRFNPYGEVSFFDVGQGDSILIREPFNKSVTLVDTGGKLQFGHHSSKTYIAENSSVNYLKSIGVTKIDNLCLTHQDMDHIGETPVILQNFQVKNLIFPSGVEQTNNFRRLIMPHLKTTKLVPVLNSNHVTNLPCQILFPINPGLGKNGDSLTLKTKMGGLSFLLTGDLDLNGEKQLISNNLVSEHIDVFKLGHHGSKTANSAELLNVITPKLAIVSAGINNRYGHPNQEVIQRLSDMGIPYQSTQDKGMISYRFFYNHMGRWITGLKKKGDIK